MRLKSAPSVAVATAFVMLLAACGSDTSKSNSTAAPTSTASTGSSVASTGSSTAGPAGSTTCSAQGASTDPAIKAAQANLLKASATTSEWSGPTTGPTAQKKGALVVFVPQLSANAGDLGVVNGFKEAAAALGWEVKVIDGGGSTANELAALDQAIALKPVGILVSSFDPAASEPAFAKAKAAGIPVVANHTGFSAGPQEAAPSLFTNITSDPATIAQIAADCAIVASNGTAGISIVGCGTQVEICTTKEDAMKAEMATCPGCSVLVKHDYPFQDATQQEGGIAAADYQKYGKDLGYMLSINDIYFDAAIPALKALGVGPDGPPLMIAAGDGSPGAFGRIRDGQYQIATVAEPLNEHGWQMADEMNRALAGEAPSDYVTYPHITTIENVDSEGGDKNIYDPSNGYRDQYKKIWGVS
jgi:ribose transport system substrate-binding protein